MSRPHIKISLLNSIFISILAIFVMSHNAGALTLTDSVDLIRGNMVYQFNCLDCSNFAYSAISDYGYTRIYNPNADLQSQIRGLQLNLPSESYLSADYLTLDIFYTNDLANNSLDAYFKSITTTTTGWDLVDVSFDNLSTGGGVVHLTFKCYTAKSYTSIYIQSLGGSALYLWNNEYISSSVATHWRPKAGVNYSQAIQNVVNAINSKDYTQTLNSINESVNNINSDVEDATQDASDAAQDTADTAQDDSDATGTSLLSVFTSVIGVIINSQETTCSFDSHLPFMSGAGSIDLCMFQPPAVVQTISSLLALALFVPFGLHMYKRFISITRSFQK